MTDTATVPRDPEAGRFTPKRVVAGGLIWSAEEDDQPFGAHIGWSVAVRLGVPDKPVSVEKT